MALISKDRVASWLRPLLLLTALCWATYCLGLTTHGLTNWQEAQRAVVAREMQARHEWIVPTIEGRPYLAKPPLIYWCQLALADVRGARTGEFELRLTVALAGWLGVLATYIVARRMLGARPAWWSALFLATGFLYVRSARIGELDILLVPTTVAAIGGIFEAWRAHRERNRTNFGAVAIAALGAIGATMAKGPPGLLVIAVAGYGGAAIAEAWGRPARRERAGWIFGTLLGVAVAAASVRVGRNEGSVLDARDIAGLLMLAAMGVLVGATLVRLAEWPKLVSLIRVYSHTHPVGVLGAAALCFWGWGRMVEARVGAAAVAGAIRTEAADNLRLLVAESPINNLEAMAYGAGLGSVAAIFAAAWLPTQKGERGKESTGPAMWTLVAWAVGGLIAFSLLGKGVPRYLTPIWPALAMLGAWWFAALERDAHSPRRLAVWITAVVLALAAAQSWWYGWEREKLYSDRSPRAMVAELLAMPGVDASRLYTFEFDTPAVDYYAGRPVRALVDDPPRPNVDVKDPETLQQLRRELAANGGSAVVLIRTTQPPGMEPETAEARLRMAGFDVEPLHIGARFTIDNRKSEVETVRITAGK